MADRLEYNRLSILIPDGWSDETVVTLVGPTPKNTTPLRVSAPRTNPPSIVVKEVAKDDWAGDVEAFVKTQDELMAFSLTNAQSAVKSSLGEAPVREFVFGPPNDRLRQVIVYVKKDDRLVLVCGSAADDLAFDGVRQATAAIARAL